MINRVREYINLQKENFINDLIRFVHIPSISHHDDEIYPFGQECRNVLDEYAKNADEHGLKARNFDYSCTAIAIDENDLEKPSQTVGIWSHGDVVPVGDGWIYPPFECTYENGLIIGRGVQDNKCACMAGIYTE